MWKPSTRWTKIESTLKGCGKGWFEAVGLTGDSLVVVCTWAEDERLGINLKSQGRVAAKIGGTSEALGEVRFDVGFAGKVRLMDIRPAVISMAISKH